jgi:hypothetical protein
MWKVDCNGMFVKGINRHYLLYVVIKCNYCSSLYIVSLCIDIETSSLCKMYYQRWVNTQRYKIYWFQYIYRRMVMILPLCCYCIAGYRISKEADSAVASEYSCYRRENKCFGAIHTSCNSSIDIIFIHGSKCKSITQTNTRFPR